MPFLLLAVTAALAGPAHAQPAPAPQDGTVAAFVDAHSVTEIARAARGLRSGDRLHLEGLRLEPGGFPVGLDLERFQLFADDGRIVVHGPDGAEERPFPANAYFRGRVIGEPDSLAVLTVLEDGTVRGIVRREGAFWELAEGPPRADGSRGLAARSVEAPEDAGFECATDELTAPHGALETTTESSTTESSTTSTTSEDGSFEATTAEATTTSYTARVAVETDYELYQDFGGDTTALTDYVGDLFAYASSMYDAEVATNLQVVHLSVWTTSDDPWTQTGTTCGFLEFGRFWNDNRTSVERTIAHFVSGKSSGSGIAWLGVLCRGAFNVDHGGSCALSPQIDNYGGAYGFSAGINGSFDPASPSPVWDIVVVSHEIGHNFNSPHTHCYNGLGGSSSPVDECYRYGSGCYDGTERLPGPAGEGSGTIMSYCHLLSPGMSNLSLTFGTGHPYGELPQRVPDRMRAHVESVASSAPACLERVDSGTDGESCEDETLVGLTVDSTEVFEACGTLSAGDGFAIVDPGDVTLRGNTVILDSGFSVDSGAKLRVEIH